MQDTVRDALGVHEDAIAVEQNRGEILLRSHGPILSSAKDAGSHRPDRHRTGPIDGSHGRADCRAHTGPIVTAEYRTRAEASAQTMMTNANSVSQAPAGSREPCARI